MNRPRNLARALAVALAASPVAAADDPAGPVREAYRLERESLGPHFTSEREPPWRAPHRDRLFTRRFAELWATEERHAEVTREMGNIDLDPFISGQDYGEDVLHDLLIEVEERKPDRALVCARFTNLRRVTVRFVVVREDGRWVIDDILDTVDGAPYSVSRALARPYTCSDLWKERCRNSSPRSVRRRRKAPRR